MTEAVWSAGAGARGWVEARTLATHARCDDATLVASIRDGDLTAFRINGVLLIPAPAASAWLEARDRSDEDPPAWDPDSHAARWRMTNHAVTSAHLLTVAQAADIIGVTPNRVYGIIRTRRMVGRVVNGRIWVDPSDIADYLERFPPRVSR